MQAIFWHIILVVAGCQIAVVFTSVFSLYRVHNELVNKLQQAALMTSALESQLKRY